MLLSFVANESITNGASVAVLDSPLGRIQNIDPLFFSEARAVGVAVDTVPSGGLCRVISRGEANLFAGLEPGSTYYAPLAGTTPVVYSGFVNVFETLPASGAYLCSLGIAINSTTLSVNLATPVFVQKDSLD